MGIKSSGKMIWEKFKRIRVASPTELIFSILNLFIAYGASSCMIKGIKYKSMQKIGFFPL